MTKTITLFVPNAMYEELLYQYEKKDADLRKLIFGFLSPLGQQGKMVELHQTLQVRVYKKGKLAMEDVDLRTVDMTKHVVEPDNDWIPPKVTKAEIKVYKQQISDRLYTDLRYFANVFHARLDLYNETVDKKAKDYTPDRIAVLPTCFEQVIQDHCIDQLSQAVSGNIQLEYDSEFEELEKGIAEKESKKEKKPSPKR